MDIQTHLRAGEEENGPAGEDQSSGTNGGGG